ncbi:MAG TPA: hypothetical protein ENH12_01100, partial [Proteobacteria bacterium]|nr:hypothetical protein [Pseudomonadota bacterium]
TSLANAARILQERGAKDVYAVVTHPVLPGNAVNNIEQSPIKTLWVSDTIPLREDAHRAPKIKTISIANLLGEAINRIHADTPVSILFEYSEDPENSGKQEKFPHRTKLNRTLAPSALTLKNKNVEDKKR